MASTTHTNPTGDSQDNNQNCLEQWKEDLIATSNALIKTQAKAAQAYQLYAYSATWENKLKIYCENVEQTNDLIAEILVELGQFCGQVQVVCENTKCVVQALDVLFCYLKDFFTCTDALNTSLSNLINRIKCLNDPNLGSSIILKCLNDMSEKLTATIAGQREILKLIINILKMARILKEMICESEEHDCGLYDQLGALLLRFNHSGSTPGASVSTNPDSSPAPAPSTNPDTESPSCEDEEASCTGELDNKPVMPLDQDDYWDTTKDQYSRAQEESATNKANYDACREEQKKLEACKKRLSDAVAAAEEAKAC